MRAQFTAGASGIISDTQRQVLLCHRRDYDLWNLPGGGLEVGETPWDGLIREVKEETGLDVNISRLVGIYSKPHKNEIVFSFVCKVVGGEFTINNEADKIEYFGIGSLPKNIPLNHAERIIDAFENKSEIFLRVQTGKSSIELIKEGNL